MLIGWCLLRLRSIMWACGGRVGIWGLRSRLGLTWSVGVGLLDIWMTWETSSRLWRSRSRGRTRGGIVGRRTRGIKVGWLLLRGNRCTTTWATKVLSLFTNRRTRSGVRAILWRRKLSLWRHTWMSTYHITSTTSATHAHHVHSSSHAPHRVHGAVRRPTRARATG